MLAESHLLTATTLDPQAHKAWLYLGTVLRSQGELQRASECLQTAIDLEATAPVIPFNLLPMMV